MLTYRKDLVEAIERSETQGINAPFFCIESNIAYLDESNRAKISHFLNKVLYHATIENIAQECMFWNYYLKRGVDDILCCDSLLTIGYVEFKDKMLFINSEDDIKSWFANKHDKIQNRPIHTWLTLPSLEIVDITIIASCIKIMGEEFPLKEHGNCNMGRANSQDLNQIKYRPQYVGLDFLHKTGIKLREGQ